MRESTKTLYVKVSVVESYLCGLVRTVKIEEAANKCLNALFSLNGDKSGQQTRIKNRKAPDIRVLLWWHRRS